MNKTFVDFKSLTEKALEHYVLDREAQSLSKEEIIGLVNLKKAVPTDKLLPRVFPEAVVGSNTFVEYLRDLKLRVNILGGRSTKVNDEIERFSNELWGHLENISTQVKQLEADIQEEEIKAQDRYQLVHYNSFIRPIDTSYRDLTSPAIDWKTGQPFPLGYELKLIPGAGLTLPEKYVAPLFIRSVSLVDESTDVGDTVLPLIKTDPMDILEPNNTFKYVIARRTYDTTGRLYNYTESTCQLCVELGGTQIVNHLELKTIASSPIFLKKLEYLNDANELVQANIDTLPIDGKIDILMEPIRTRILLLTLVQYAPVEEARVVDGELLKTEINKLLAGAGWSTLLENNGTELDTKIYDFSMADLKINLTVYKPFGYFLSQPIPLVNALSLSLGTATESIKITSEQRAYNTDYFLPENASFLESYFKLKLFNTKEEKQTEITFPVPYQAQGVQTEALCLSGNTSKVSFFPDVFYNAFKKRISRILFSSSQAYVLLEQPHGIAQGIVYTDPIELWLDRGKGIKNFVSVSWEATSDTRLVLSVDYSFGMASFITENDTPKGWIVRQLDKNPFNVYAEGTELELGTEYEYSLDNGVTWLSELITYNEYSLLKENLIAGSFKIKIIEPDLSKFYWISYRRAIRQYLHPSKLVVLKGQSIVLSKKLRRFHGNVQVLLVSRTDSRTPYLTSVVQNYKLKVRQL